MIILWNEKKEIKFQSSEKQFLKELFFVLSVGLFVGSSLLTGAFCDFSKLFPDLHKAPQGSATMEPAGNNTAIQQYNPISQLPQYSLSYKNHSHFSHHACLPEFL